MSEVKTWIESIAPSMEEELIELCNLNSGSDNLGGLTQVEDWLVQYFEPLNAECERIPLPPYAQVSDLGETRPYQTGRALRWNFGSGTGKPILLSIHYDTVYGSDSKFQQCERWSESGEPRLRGPGVIDAKGGIVIIRNTILGAIRWLDMSKQSISVVLTPDEEIGSPSTLSLWRKIANEFRFAMLYEPTLADGSFVSHRKGTGTYIAVVRGKAAHSGRNFYEGRNAILLASKLAIRLDQLNGKREGVTVNVGRVRGGDAVNVVPDLCVMRINIRVQDSDEQQWLQNEVNAIVDELNSSADGMRIEMQGEGISSPPKELSRLDTQWQERVERVAQSVGQSIRWKGSGGASDGNKLLALGLQNIDTFGPEGDGLHSEKEWIRLSSLARKVELSLAMLESLQ